MQNIPSHNQEVRLLFRATSDEQSINIKEDSFYELNKWAQVETINGWKPVHTLQLNEILVGDETRECIVNIINDDNIYRIYTRMVGDANE